MKKRDQKTFEKVGFSGSAAPILERRASLDSNYKRSLADMQGQVEGALTRQRASSIASQSELSPSKKDKKNKKDKKEKKEKKEKKDKKSKTNKTDKKDKKKSEVDSDVSEDEQPIVKEKKVKAEPVKVEEAPVKVEEDAQEEGKKDFMTEMKFADLNIDPLTKRAISEVFKYENLTSV